MTKELALIKKELDTQLQDKEVLQTLLQTTFKGLQAPVARQAALEAMLRGFDFDDFLKKNIYAVPFGNGYSLVTSIDYARKIGMRSGIVGKGQPIFTTKPEGDIEWCSVTVQKKVGDHVGEFTSLVFFDEYTTKRGLWLTKPKTMIAKVAEMHALRMACPEELSQAYVEEEKEREILPPIAEVQATDDFKAKLEGAKNIEELQQIWSSLPGFAKGELNEVKNALKEALTPKKVGEPPVVNKTPPASKSKAKE